MDKILDELLYEDNKKALYKQGAFYVLRTINIEKRESISSIITKLPDWYIIYVRDKKIDDILNKDN